MSAVGDLQRHVEAHGYTTVDVEALKILAGYGWSPEKAAGIVLDARRSGRDPVAQALHFNALAAAARR